MNPCAAAVMAGSPPLIVRLPRSAKCAATLAAGLTLKLKRVRMTSSEAAAIRARLLRIVQLAWRRKMQLIVQPSARALFPCILARPRLFANPRS